MLGIPSNHLEKTAWPTKFFPLAHTKHHFIHHIPSKLLSQNCKQINRVRKKIHGKTSSLLSYMKVPDYLDIFTFSISGARNTSMSIRFKLHDENNFYMSFPSFFGTHRSFYLDVCHDIDNKSLSICFFNASHCL